MVRQFLRRCVDFFRFHHLCLPGLYASDQGDHELRHRPLGRNLFICVALLDHQWSQVLHWASGADGIC